MDKAQHSQHTEQSDLQIFSSEVELEGPEAVDTHSKTSRQRSRHSSETLKAQPTSPSIDTRSESSDQGVSMHSLAKLSVSRTPKSLVSTRKHDIYSKIVANSVAHLLTFLRVSPRGCALSFLAGKERHSNNLHTLLSPSRNTEFYGRVYPGCDYAGDLIGKSYRTRGSAKDSLRISYQPDVNAAVPLLCGRIAPIQTTTFDLHITSLPLALLSTTGSLTKRGSVSRPLLRIALCSLGRDGGTTVHGNVVSIPLENDTLKFMSIPESVADEKVKFLSVAGSALTVRADTRSIRSLFVLFEITLLFEPHKNRGLLFEVAQGVSFMSLSPASDFDRVRPAKADKKRVNDLVKRIVGTEILDAQHSAAKSAAKGKGRGLNNGIALACDKRSLPVYEGNISRIGSVIGGTASAVSGGADSGSIVVTIKHPDNEVSERATRLPKNIIVPPNSIKLLDHVAGLFASMVVLPRSLNRFCEPDLGNGGVESLLPYAYGQPSAVPEVSTCEDILRRFGRFPVVYRRGAILSPCGSSSLYYMAAHFNSVCKKIPAGSKNAIAQAILPPVSLGIKDTLYLTNFVLALRTFGPRLCWLASKQTTSTFKHPLIWVTEDELYTTPAATALAQPCKAK